MEIPAGTWLHNPVTGELAEVLVGAKEGGGLRVEADLWLQPGAALAGAHFHEHLIEIFEVIEGEVGFIVDGAESSASGGDEAVEVPAGAVHDWWNAGESHARVRVQVIATKDAPGGLAPRFTEMITALWSLGALGKVDEKGMPGPLWLMAIAREYRDVIRFEKPPAFVQTLLFTPMAAVARATGRDPLAGELHGMDAACVIPSPDEKQLEDLLSHRVSGAA